MTETTHKRTKTDWLEIESELTLHTINAQHFFWGRVKDSCSLPDFNQHIMAIKVASKQDDPFADWVLLRTYDAIVQTYRKLYKFEDKLRQLLKPEEGLTFKLASHKEPVKLWIRFNMPYTRAAIHCLASYDRITRSFLASQASCLKPDHTLQSQLQTAGELLRQMLITPKQWQRTDVTRSDIHTQTEQGKIALELFAGLGQLPASVLTGALRAPQKIILENL
jgi:integrating conjugative element protein (TIGR03761 family)